VSFFGPSRLLFLDDDIGAHPHHTPHDNPQAHLADHLEAPFETVLVFTKHLNVIIQKADQPQPDGRNDHQPDIHVGQVAEQQNRNQDRGQNNQSAHRRGSPFLELAFEPQVPHLFPDLVTLQEADNASSENHPDRQSQNHPHRSPERQRHKHPDTGHIKMLRQILQ